LEDSLVHGSALESADNDAENGHKNSESCEEIVNLSKNSTSSTNTSGNVELSFQDVINDISHEQGQKDVSLSFYFICLLHLANEKVSLNVVTL
jgi:hypothetical protein